MGESDDGNYNDDLKKNDGGINSISSDFGLCKVSALDLSPLTRHSIIVSDVFPLALCLALALRRILLEWVHLASVLLLSHQIQIEH